MKKLKHLLLASSTSVALVTVCLMSIPVNAGLGYYFVPHTGGGLFWTCDAYVKCWYETPDDWIHYDDPVSLAYDVVYSSGDVSHTVMARLHETEEMAIRQQVEVDFTSWFDEWTVDTESWSYPQYDPEPTGGYWVES